MCRWWRRRTVGTALRDCGLNAAGYPKCFDPRLALQSRRCRGALVDHDAARRPQHRVQIYNDLLLDLAEGKQVDGAGQRVKELTAASSACCQPGSELAAHCPRLANVVGGGGTG